MIARGRLRIGQPSPAEAVMVDACQCGRATSPTVVARSWVIGITTMQYS